MREVSKKKCDKCGQEVFGVYTLSNKPRGLPRQSYDKYPGSYCRYCAQILQLKILAEEIEGKDLDGDDTPDSIRKVAAPVKIYHVHKMVAWMRRGIGPDAGGEWFATTEFNGREFDLYMCRVGIYGTREFPAYFYDNAGNWYRVNCNLIQITPI